MKHTLKKCWVASVLYGTSDTILNMNIYIGWEICAQVKKQQLELGMEQQTGSK